jgi:hypothetical protein
MSDSKMALAPPARFSHNRPDIQDGLLVALGVPSRSILYRLPRDWIAEMK